MSSERHTIGRKTPLFQTSDRQLEQERELLHDDVALRRAVSSSSEKKEKNQKIEKKMINRNEINFGHNGENRDKSLRTTGKEKEIHIQKHPN